MPATSPPAPPAVAPARPADLKPSGEGWVWITAMGQIFFSLSLAVGAMVRFRCSRVQCAMDDMQHRWHDM